MTVEDKENKDTDNVKSDDQTTRVTNTADDRKENDRGQAISINAGAVSAIEERISKSIAEALSPAIQALLKDADNARYVKRQIEDVIKVLETESDGWADKTKQHEKQLKDSITRLNEENFVLRKLPDKVKEGIKEVVPEIARELDRLHREILTTFNENVKVCNDNLNKLSENSLKFIKQNKDASNSAMDELIIKSRELSSNYIKKFFANAVLIMVIATMVSLGTSYYIVQKMPSKVMINEASGQMHIQKSDINIWGSDYKVKERMKYKKD